MASFLVTNFSSILIFSLHFDALSSWKQSRNTAAYFDRNRDNSFTDSLTLFGGRSWIWLLNKVSMAFADCKGQLIFQQSTLSRLKVSKLVFTSPFHATSGALMQIKSTFAEAQEGSRAWKSILMLFVSSDWERSLKKQTHGVRVASSWRI